MFKQFYGPQGHTAPNISVFGPQHSNDGAISRNARAHCSECHKPLYGIMYIVEHLLWNAGSRSGVSFFYYHTNCYPRYVIRINQQDAMRRVRANRAAWTNTEAR